jgi:hypothetical protein
LKLSTGCGATRKLKQQLRINNAILPPHGQIDSWFAITYSACVNENAEMRMPFLHIQAFSVCVLDWFRFLIPCRSILNVWKLKMVTAKTAGFSAFTHSCLRISLVCALVSFTHSRLRILVCKQFARYRFQMYMYNMLHGHVCVPAWLLHTLQRNPHSYYHS